jgi:hypothetical protein
MCCIVDKKQGTIHTIRYASHREYGMAVGVTGFMRRTFKGGYNTTYSITESTIIKTKTHRVLRGTT